LEQVKHIYSGSSPPEDLKIPPTVGLNIGKLDVRKRTRFLFWDLGGSKSLRVLWDKYYADSHAVLFILDSSDPQRMDENVSEIQRVLQDKDLQGAPILILANKQDLKQAMGTDAVRQNLKEEQRRKVQRSRK
jgi:ADP-ribosylation factor related protein 1